jgi:hypothetical protein
MRFFRAGASAPILAATETSGGHRQIRSRRRGGYDVGFKDRSVFGQIEHAFCCFSEQFDLLADRRAIPLKPDLL